MAALSVVDLGRGERLVSHDVPVEIEEVALVVAQRLRFVHGEHIRAEGPPGAAHGMAAFPS